MNPITSVITLIKQALAALTAYLELKRETFFYEATNEHLAEKEAIRNEITKLRNQRTVDATDRADMLLLRIQEKDKAWGSVSAAYTRYTGRNDDSH